MRRKNCVLLLAAGRRTQINYAISPNPWEVIFPAPVEMETTFYLSLNAKQYCGTLIVPHIALQFNVVKF